MDSTINHDHDQTLWRLEKKGVGYKRARYPGIPSLCSAQDRVAPNLPHVRLNHYCVGLVGLVSNDENQHFPPQKRDPCKSQTSSIHLWYFRGTQLFEHWSPGEFQAKNMAGRPRVISRWTNWYEKDSKGTFGIEWRENETTVTWTNEKWTQ